MRKLYTHARNIYLINQTLEQRLALLPAPPRPPPVLRGLIQPPPRGGPAGGGRFHLQRRAIHAASPRVFRDQPRRLMRVFLQAQQRGLRLHPDLAQLDPEPASLADTAFQNDEHVRETFRAS